MKLKPLALVVALLALAAGIVFWHNHAPATDASADPRNGQPLVPVETLGAIRGLRLVSEGRTLVLVADADGKHWTVPDYFGLPADFDKLVSFVESLRTAKIARFVTARADRIERLGFAGDLIELRDAAAKPLLTLHLGKNSDNGGRFVRIGDEQKAYLVDLNAWLDTVPKNWARSQLLDVKPSEVAALELRFADGSTLAAKRNADATAWTADALPEGKELKSADLDALVTQLTTLRFTETTEPAAPDAVSAREHAQTVVLTLKDGTAYTVALGRRPAPPAENAPAPAAEKLGTISATTPPVTIGPDGQAQVVELPQSDEPESAAPKAAPAKPSPQPGPVFVFIAANRDADPLNALMQKRAFQTNEWVLTSLPANCNALLQAKPTPTPAEPKAEATPATDSAPAK
jgi:hypothetical protein